MGWQGARASCSAARRVVLAGCLMALDWLRWIASSAHRRSPCVSFFSPPPADPAVFRDADDEFGSLAAVKRRLEEWKARQPGAYRDAYVSLSAPALFAPFVRLELLKWRPLHGGDAGGCAARA